MAPPWVRIANESTLVFRAIADRTPPDNAVDLTFPIGSSTYPVASGGSTQAVNGHFTKLEPKTHRQRA